MKRFLRLAAFVLLLAASLTLTPGDPLAAQGTTGPGSETPGTEAPETFVPTEELPAGSAVSFPIDI